MTGRFLYHFFWNTYDYLGTYVLLGFAAVCPLVACAAVFLSAGAGGGPAGLLVAIVIASAALLTAGSATAGFQQFASVAAQDEAARMRHFIAGMKRDWLRFTSFWLAVGAAVLVAGTNVAFYLHFGGRLPSPALRMGLVCLAMLFAWGAVAIVGFAMPVAACLSRFREEDSTVRMAVRRAAFVFILCPFTWLGNLLFVLILSALLLMSVVGVVLIPAVLATASCTGLELTQTYARLLGQAKDELGAGRPVGEYRRRARELYAELDASKPVRGLRELIRPWEN